MVVGRFQVMTMLQAARAYVLGMPIESAYSWGLNRAIFIAAAKRGFKGGAGAGKGGSKGGGTSKATNTYFLGDDMAYKTVREGVLLFTIGGKVQTKEEFDKRVKSRFGDNFSKAWKEALAYVKGFDKETLLSADDFFRTAYRPARDDLAETWTESSQVSDK
ncbi:MAG TPA: hypothetical protein VGR56_10425 [Nitrososphaerales archaeon]|nr:hypothetical protein [Nitrososphaerales archaeon]